MTKKFTSFFLAVLLCISSIVTLTVSAAPNTSYNTEKNYNDIHKGTVDGSNTATVEDVTSGYWFWSQYDYTKITPNPSGSPDKVVKIDHYNLDTSLNISSKYLEYISIYCQYNGS